MVYVWIAKNLLLRPVVLIAKRRTTSLIKNTEKGKRMNRKEMLDETAKCVLQDRQSTHRPPEDTFDLIAKFWSAYLGVTIEPYKVGVLMGLMKIARIKHNPSNTDNFVDAGGYMACSCELATSQSTEKDLRICAICNRKIPDEEVWLTGKDGSFIHDSCFAYIMHANAL
jgi:hypothetical protein